MKKQLPGFALLEAAMALMILGIIASFTFPMITSLMTYERTKRTADHREQILRALAGYALVNGTLPRPGKPGAVNYVNRGACSGAECKGIVPYEELGIPKNMAKDGHGHWFTYVVHSGMTGNYKDRADFFKYIENIKKPLLVLKEVIKEDDLNKENNPVAIILINHGPSGGGAYHEDTQEKYPTDNQYEQINAADDLNFVTGDAKDFFHQVSWVSKIHFVAHYMRDPMSLKTKNDGAGNDVPTSDNHAARDTDQLSATNNARNVENVHNMGQANNNIDGNPKIDRETKIENAKKIKRDFIRKPNQQNNISSNQPGNK